MRKIICFDAIEWLKNQKDNSLSTIVTSIPDTSTIKKDSSMNIEEYETFLRLSIKLFSKKVKETEYIILIQTDRRNSGEWLDKSYILIDEAKKNGLKLLWHKITANKFDNISFIMAGYSHILCFSKKAKPGKTFPDLIIKGEITYYEATGYNTAKTIIEFLVNKTDTIIDPFVGRGTIVAMANAYGIKAIGIDKYESQCNYAKKLTITKGLYDL